MKDFITDFVNTLNSADFESLKIAVADRIILEWSQKTRDIKVATKVDTNSMQAVKLNESERIMLDVGKVVDAVKSLRIRYNIGLKEAKFVVDQYRGA